MFYRRYPKKKESPFPDKENYIYVEEGEEYDSEEYETDSDYDGEEESASCQPNEENKYPLDSRSDGPQSGLNGLKDEEISSIISDNSDPASTSSSLKSESNESGEIAQDETALEHDRENSNSDELTLHTDINETVSHGNEGNLEEKVTAPPAEKPLASQDKLDLENSKGMSKNDLILHTNVNQTAAQEDEEDSKKLVSTSSLAEKRFLLFQAVEHDRVDIIKKVFQTQESIGHGQSDKCLIQLLLNNRLSPPYTEEDKEDVFIPPLHVAIATSSTGAVNCLLRMGADPSIRPVVLYSDNLEKLQHLNNKTNWNLLHNVSAWELAFGSNEKYNQEEAKSYKKKAWYSKLVEDNENTDVDVSLQEDSNNMSCIDIMPSKLEGIKNAFLSEALRAIGSDEVNRLRELLDSGLSATTNVGGKNLLEWCAEMNVVGCTEILKHKVTSTHNINDKETLVSKATHTNETPASSNTECDEISEVSCIQMKKSQENYKLQLEESESLVAELSSILDNIAEEVSITQSLIYHRGASNSALLLQVRSLKESRSTKDEEISEWEVKLFEVESELTTVKKLWTNQGRDIEKLPNENAVNCKVEFNSELSATSPKNYCTEKNETASEMSTKLALNRSKVKNLRSSISDLGLEYERNMAKVENIGLSCVVKLSRNLREEVHEKENKLENIKRCHATVHSNVKMIRYLLEEGMTDIPSNPDVEGLDKKQNVKINSQHSKNVSNEKKVENVQRRGRDTEFSMPSRLLSIANDSIPTPGTADDAFAEQTNESLCGTNDQNIEFEQEDDDLNKPVVYDETIAISQSPSQTIASGDSSALMSNDLYNNYMPSHIWKLILRIVGIGRKVVQRNISVGRIGKDNDRVHIMIV